jgi:hypothetical protein
MGSLSSHLRSNLYDLPVEVRTSRPVADLIGLAVKPPQSVSVQAQKALKPRTINRRARIWELNSHLHCSIIGTCMSAGELRRVLGKLKIGGIETADEHELHMLGVLLADRPDQGAKVLQKALDRRHEVTLHRFAKARDDLAVGALWQQSIKGGDIAGAYWAVLTHADSSDKLVQKAFGDVHMLSHLMGATNCADLHRMSLLEDENAVLVAKLERQQKQLRDGFVEKDEKIQRLTNLLAAKIQNESEHSPNGDAEEVNTLKTTIADLNRQLAREASRRERMEQRQKTFEDAESGRRRAEAERDTLRAELDILESQIESALPGVPASPAATLNLTGSTILYVGGRTSQIPQLRALVERGGGEFVHHDGGIEHAGALLPGLVGRSDLTVFPVDCVSHNAMTSAKRACQQLNKPFVALRTSSLASLLSSLASRYSLTAPEGV